MSGEEQDAGEEERSAPDAPGDATPIPSYDSGRRARLTTLKRLPSFEANLAAAKLEAAGIPAFVDDEFISAAHPLLFRQVRLQVDESDLERAQAVLAVAPAVSGEGEYVEEEYRCPNCHRKAVDLVPLSGRMKSTRLGCFGVLLLPVVAFALTRLLPLKELDASWRQGLLLVWGVALAVLSYIVLTAKRRKRCRECAHEW